MYLDKNERNNLFDCSFKLIFYGIFRLPPKVPPNFQQGFLKTPKVVP